MANAVYDPDTEGEQQYHPPNLDQADGSSDPRTIHKKPGESKGGRDGSDLRDAERDGDSLYNPEGEGGESGTSSAGGLQDREKDGAGSAIGTGTAGGQNFKFNDRDKGGRLQTAINMIGKHKKGIGVGAGVGGGLAAIGLSVFLMLIPLKIEHIVQNLEKRFFASSENAVDRESRKMLTQYISQHVLPGYKGKCGTTIDKHCSPVGLSGNNPVTKMYRSWADARLENKLAEDYGIEFKYDTQSKNWYMKAPGASANGDNIGPDGGGLDTDFERHDRAGLRAAVSDAFEHETRWKKVMYRYKVGRLLEEKYGLKRCIVFCGTRDQLADKKDAKLKAAKLYLVQRVITPRTQTLGPILECLINGCDPTKTKPTDAQDGTTGELNGAPENPETDTQIREIDQQLGQQFTSATAEEMSKSVDRIREKGFTRWVLEEVLTKVGLSDMLAKQLSSTIPVIGWVTKAATIIHFARHAGPALQKLGYIANSGSAVQLYQMNRTYADELHTGHIDATELGSFTDALGPGDHGTPSDPQVGGTAGAESAPLYKNLIDHENNASQSVTIFNNLLPGKAEAASNSNDPSYTCQDGKPVPSGQLVCSEEVFGSVQGIASAALTASKFLGEPVVNSVSSVADAIYNASNGLFGPIADLTNWIIKNVPPFNLGASALSSVTSFLIDKLQPFFTDALNKLIKNPFSDVMSGGRTFDMMAAGADVAGNDYAHTGLGGKKLNPQQVADIVNQQQDQARQQFNSQPFFARMFDTNSDYSLVTKVAMDIPLGTQAEARSGLAAIISPFNAITHGFASLFSGKAIAAVTPQPDTFGVGQYGYTSDDLNKIGLADKYWDKHCSDNASNAYMKDNSWNESAAHNNDPGTGMPVNTTTNPCLLIKGTTGSGGGFFDTSNLTSDDLADLNASGGGSTGPTTPAPSGDFTNPFPGGWVPNRLDMGYDGTVKGGQIVAPFSGTVTYAGPFNGWRTSSGVIIKADKDVGLATRSLYFTEGVAPITSLQGKHVDVGTPIANTTASPYGSYQGQSTSVGAIEWGVAEDGSIGHQTDTEAVAMGTCTAAAKSMVLTFSQWVVNSLHVAKYDTSLSDNNPGCP